MSNRTSKAVKTAFLGIDIGTQGARAVIVDEDGVMLGTGSAPIPAGRRGGWSHEQNPETWWTGLVSAVRDALFRVGDSAEIVALAVDATSGTVLVEAADGRPVGAALMYDDARAHSQAEIAQRAGRELWQSLGYRMQPAWALPKAMWLHEEGRVHSGSRVVHQSDHLIRRLTGTTVATDTSHALKTGVDLRDGRWPASLLSELGIPLQNLPEVVSPSTVLGVVGAEAARATGLVQGTVIRAGMTDGCAAQIASGALQPGSWSSALGTTLVIKGSTTDLIHDPTGSVYCHRSPDGGWLPGGASSTGAGAIVAAFPELGSDGLNELARRVPYPVPAEGVTYALTGSGERFPFVAPQARGFLAPEVESDEVLRFGALCQSIAFIERLSYEVLGSLGADVSGTVSLSGGATANAWWNQLRADVLGRTVQIPESVEAAFGMAVLAASETGALAETAARMVRVTRTFVPDPERSRYLEDGYRALLESLTERGWFTPGPARQDCPTVAGR